MSVCETSEGRSRRVDLVPLGDIAEIIGGKPAPQGREHFSEDGIPFVRMKDLGRYHQTENLVEVTDHIRPELVQEKRWKPVKAGAILMPRSGSVALNHRAILGRDAIIVSHICALEVKSPKVCNRYLYRFLCSIRLDKITKKTTGLDAVNFADLRKLTIPLPPLDEQRRIAAILDKADAIRRKREQALALADDLLKSTFLEMFGDPVINDKNWLRKPLGELLLRIDSGQSPRCEARTATQHEYGILKVSAVSSTRFRPDENKAVKDGFVPREEHLVKKGDLLFSRKNTYDLVGATAIVEQEVGQLAMPDLIFRLVPNIDVVTTEFLWSALTQPNVREAMRRRAGGAAASMPNIGKQKLLGLEIACPPPEAQRRFSRVFLQVREAHAKQSEAMNSATELFASLSQRAFRGEL